MWEWSEDVLLDSFCWNRTGNMELYSVCVLTEGVLVQGRNGECIEDVLLERFCWNRTGYIELGSLCVMTEGVLVKERMWEWSEDVQLDSCLLEQDRIYGVMFCMCIDSGFVGKGEIVGVE